jgi:steroid 5-alpha reductase family enzyme
MTLDLSPFFRAAWVTLTIQTGGFLAAYALQTEVFYDILGGINFIVLAALGHARHGNTEPPASSRHVALTCLFVASRGWLLVFLAWRAHHRKGDSRFDGVKDKFGWFLVFWMVQGLWVFLISWPLLVVQAFDHPSQRHEQLTPYDQGMLVALAAGITLEIVADIQKTLWIRRGRQGGFCTVGLWSLSRHPNYFGEIFQWWCAWLVSYGSVATADRAAGGVWCAGMVSPLFTMTILLTMSGTGVWAAEGKNLQRYYESEHAQAYKEYRQSTSPLIPMLGYKRIPMSIKRQFLFEWERFEYNPKKKE